MKMKRRPPVRQPPLHEDRGWQVRGQVVQPTPRGCKSLHLHLSSPRQEGESEGPVKGPGTGAVFDLTGDGPVLPIRLADSIESVQHA